MVYIIIVTIFHSITSYRPEKTYVSNKRQRQKRKNATRETQVASAASSLTWIRTKTKGSKDPCAAITP